MTKIDKQQSSRQMARNLIKFSNYSVCVTLPKSALEELGWKSGQRVYMSPNIEKGTLTISKKIQPQEAKITDTSKSKAKITDGSDSEKLRW